MNKTNDLYVCPKCLLNLEKTEQHYFCKNCDYRWNITETGIPNFSTRNYWWNHLNQNEMTALLKIAEENDWSYALEKVLLPRTSEYVFNYASQESRADWHFLLDLKPNARILDIGCGWGASTIAMARHYSKIYGIDTNLYNLKFIQIRAQQEQLDNIVLAKTNPMEFDNLPYQDEYFDAVILNGVLEWIGAAKETGSPRDSQIRALREIWRVLNTQGQVYIGIENRYSYGNFLGGKAHNGVPFADVLPRSLANLLSKSLGKPEGFRTYTYSIKGYRDLFKSSGFVLNKAYFPYPDYRFPKAIIPLFNRGALDHWATSSLTGVRSYLARIASRLGLLKYFVHGFQLILGKHNVPK